MHQAYQAAMAERKASAAAASGSSTQPVLPDGLKLEPETVLLHPGKKLGEMKVIREAGAEALSISAAITTAMFTKWT